MNALLIGRPMRILPFVLIATLVSCGEDQGGGDQSLGQGQEGPGAPAPPPPASLSPPPRPTEELYDSLQAYYEDYLRDFLERPCDTYIQRADNEVHDCQRLVHSEPSGLGGQLRRAFGPLVGIMPDFDTIRDPAPDAFHEPRVVARIANAGPLPGGNGAYPLLGITAPTEEETVARFCLWLHHDTIPEEDVWRAALRRPNGPEQEVLEDCGRYPAIGDTLSWGSLEVDRRTYGAAQFDDYPNTARWQWTTPFSAQAEGQHYIDIKCGVALCSIGAPGFVPRPDSPRNGHPAWDIPTWNDAQHLAVWETVGPDSTLVPGPWGTVYPELIPDKNANWTIAKKVATFTLDPAGGPTGGPGRYVSKLNQAGSTSWLELTWSGVADEVPEGTYRNQSTPSRPASDIHTSGIPHGTHGSARWRWLDDKDETAWVPCPEYGCCDADEAL